MRANHQVFIDHPFQNQDYPNFLEMSGTDGDYLESDAGSLGPVIFSLANPSEDFELIQSPADPNTYALGLKHQLDFETQRSFQLEIQLTDSPDVLGNTFDPRVQIVFIVVDDVGDSAPVWKSYPSLVPVPEMTEVVSDGQ